MSAAPMAMPDIEEMTDTTPEQDTPWNVVVWDDPVNLMAHVVRAFIAVFGWTVEVAENKMLEVHTNGKTVVASCDDREEAESFVHQLHAEDLQATLEKDR